MTIAIFCSANNNIDAEYFKLTEELGKRLAKEGHSIVFGGCNMGLMECVTKAMHDAGGRTIGVIPSMIEKYGRLSDYVDVDILCDNLSDRKEIMLSKCDVAIALPGGIGTLDEIFTVVASHTIGYHHKKVILYNMKGFWGGLILLLEDLRQRGMIRGNYTDYIRVASSVDEIMSML
ncbi:MULTISPECIES: LOG family protein [Prevotellaceae]|uniref:LOG family protein n=1 Tax=Prevotellaceae TaxID=171552 RepID=UPI0003D2E3AA|nr:TIGR00730 family Rossman fold protein [Prevotella phocaeensis]ETD18815.1 TIGR00730 family protein [Hoylesella oralis CC98A]